MKRFKSEEDLNGPPKRFIKNRRKLKPIKRKRCIKNKNPINDLTIALDKYIKSNFIKKIKNYNTLDKSKYKFYYIFLINCYEKRFRKNYLIEEELNNLEYIYYRKIEDRKWYEIFMSIFKINYDFASTFFIFNNKDNYRDYRFYNIKIMIYINSIILSIVINIFFYNDETMHKIYKEVGEYNVIYNLPIIFVSDISMKLMSMVFEKLIDYQDEFIELRIELNNIKSQLKTIKNESSNSVIIEKNNFIYKNININIVNYSQKTLKSEENRKLNNYPTLDLSEDFNIGEHTNIDIINKKKIIMENKIIKNIGKKRIIFYIISIILNIISWYYVSCFCAVYINTQKHILYDFLYGIPMSIGSC